MDDDNLEPKDELKEIELPEPDDDAVLGELEEDDLLGHPLIKKAVDGEENESLDELADEELDEEDEPYDDVDHW